MGFGKAKQIDYNLPPPQAFLSAIGRLGASKKARAGAGSD